MTTESNHLSRPVRIPKTIPADWCFKELISCCRPKQWPTLAKTDFSDNGYPVYGANGFIGFYSTYTHDIDVIAIGCRGTCGTIQKIPGKSYINGNAMVLENVDETIVIKSFLYHALSYRNVSDAVTGSAQPQITRYSLRRVKFPHPHIKEQEAIARVLDAADTVIEQTREVAERARALKTSLIADAFERIGGTQKRLGEYIIDIRYGTSQAANERGWGNPTLRIPNVIADDISFNDLTYVDTKPADIERLKLQDGDLLLVRTNGNPNYVGRSAVFKKPDHRTWLFASYLIRVRLDGRLNPDYVNIFLGKDHGRCELLRRVTTSAGNHNINANSIRLIKLPVPESKDDQREVIEIAGKSRAYVNSIVKKLGALEQLKKGLMHDLLTGKVRVNHAIDKILSSEAS